MIEHGVLKNEICNRNGCAGIIEEHEKEGSCSCHIHPPCGYCTTDTAYCPVCDWHAGDDYKPTERSKEDKEREAEYYRKQIEEWQAARELFYKRYAGKEPIEKLEIRCEPHTHFSQKQIGVFPKGTKTREDILPLVVGTFGGRFTSFTDHNFSYIAYTD